MFSDRAVAVFGVSGMLGSCVELGFDVELMLGLELHQTKGFRYVPTVEQ